MKTNLSNIVKAGSACPVIAHILLILFIGAAITSCSSGGDDSGISSGASSPSLGVASSSSDGRDGGNSSPNSGDASSSSGGGGSPPSGGSSSSSGANDYYRYYDPYSTIAQRCQNGFVESKCGDGWYSPLTQVCVSNQAKTTAEYCESVGGELCGSGCYIPTSTANRCQNGVVENKCGEEWYRTGTIDDNGIYYTCSNNAIVETRYERCGSGWYYPGTYRCQNGVVETQCGDRWYNYTTQVCHKETIDGTISQTVIDKEKCGASNFIITHKCFVSKSTYNPETQFCYNGSQVFDKCGGSTYDPTSYFCYDNQPYSLCGNSKLEYNPKTQYCKNGILASYAGSITDSRDGKRYNTTIIGEQTWMAENLNYNAEGSKCYNDLESNCDKYGRLYNWATAMVLDANCNSNDCASLVDVKHRGICPSGWHIPSYADWNTLMKFVNPDCVNNSCAGAGTKLKAASGWNMKNSGGNNGTDDFGFSALPGGGNYSSDYAAAGSLGYWWSAREGSSLHAYYMRMYDDDDDVDWGSYPKGYSFSVRCVKD